MDGWNKTEEREKVPVTPRREQRGREAEHDLPEYDGGFDTWRRATETPRRWCV
jgi:hypothetical protein